MGIETAKSGLVDQLDEQGVLEERIDVALDFFALYMKRSNSEFYRHLIEHDTSFLAEMETIDYSMLLGRYPIQMFHDKPDRSRHQDPLALPKKVEV